MVLAFLSRYRLENLVDWLIGGVDSSIAGNGGKECVAFLDVRRRIIESVVALAIGFAYIWVGWSKLKVPALPKVVREDRGGKRALTVLMCLTFGLEVGFKFSSKTLIYLLNPCHIITMIQVLCFSKLMFLLLSQLASNVGPTLVLGWQIMANIGGKTVNAAIPHRC